jgi:hypothetical protein
VTALDLDAELLASCAPRAREGLDVARSADAAASSSPAAVRLIAVPMQTIQLLPERRAASSPRAPRDLAPGGLRRARDRRGARAVRRPPRAAAPDVGERDGWRYSLQPGRDPRSRGDADRARARAIAPDGTRRARTTRSSSPRSTPGGSRPRAAPPGSSRAAPTSPRPTPRRLEVVMLRG